MIWLLSDLDVRNVAVQFDERTSLPDQQRVLTGGSLWEAENPVDQSYIKLTLNWPRPIPLTQKT